jgi:putative glutamine amidotransferase
MPPRVAVARWEDIPGERLHNYWDRLREAGLEVVDTTGPGGSLKNCAGLVLTGGIDIDPSLYGETRHPEVAEINRPRDDFELALLREALEADVPVLAICRGHELLNVCFGGSLLQHDESGAHVWHEDEPITSSFHDVTLAPGSKLAAIYAGERIHTNSRHHQAVTPDRVANGLLITGMSDDSVVEGLESTAHRWVVGVQWHPERPEPETPGFAETSRALWDAFAAAVSSTSE